MTRSDIRELTKEIQGLEAKLDRFNGYFVSLAIAVTTMAVGAIFAASAVVIVKTLTEVTA